MVLNLTRLDRSDRDLLIMPWRKELCGLTLSLLCVFPGETVFCGDVSSRLKIASYALNGLAVCEWSESFRGYEICPVAERADGPLNSPSSA